MANMLKVEVVAADSNEGLTELLNKKRAEIQNRENDVKIQYAQPTANAEDGSVIWSSLVEEYQGHPF